MGCSFCWWTSLFPKGCVCGIRSDPFQAPPSMLWWDGIRSDGFFPEKNDAFLTVALAFWKLFRKPFENCFWNLFESVFENAVHCRHKPITHFSRQCEIRQDNSSKCLSRYWDTDGAPKLWHGSLWLHTTKCDLSGQFWCLDLSEGWSMTARSCRLSMNSTADGSESFRNWPLIDLIEQPGWRKRRKWRSGAWSELGSGVSDVWMSKIELQDQGGAAGIDCKYGGSGQFVGTELTSHILEQKNGHGLTKSFRMMWTLLVKTTEFFARLLQYEFPWITVIWSFWGYNRVPKHHPFKASGQRCLF